MNLFAGLFGTPVTAEAVRAEIWLLGARHLGRPLDGALLELAAPETTGPRQALLRACVRQLRAA